MPIVRRNSSGAQVGISLNLAQVYPATDTAADRAAADRLIGFQNRWYLDPLYGRGYPSDMLELYERHELAPSVEPNDLAIIAAPTDFLGLNYYSPSFARDEPGQPPLHASDVSLPATSPSLTRPTPRVFRSAGVSPGRCSTTSSGPSATPDASGLPTSTSQPSSARSKPAAAGSRG